MRGGGTGGVRRAAVVVGREVELDLLERAVADVRAGAAECVLLVGEGGVGKTRLLSEVASEARRQGLAVLAGRAPITTPVAFSVVAEALRSWLRGHDAGIGSTPFDAGLRLVLPEWPVGSAPIALTEAQLRLLALEGVVRLVQSIGDQQRGAVIVLDDLHAADADTLEALRYLASAAVEHVLIVGALRPHESSLPDDVVRALERDGAARVIEVEPLDRREVSDMLGALLDADPPDELVNDVVARTDGVPLLVEEVLEAHLRTGSVAVEETVPRWRGGEAVVTRTIHDMVGARLERLSRAQRDVVGAGAVLGDFDAPLLVAMTGQSDTEIAEAVMAGIDAGVLETVSGSVTFRHAVIRDAVLGALVPHVLSSLHTKAATALTDLPLDAVVAERRARHLLHIDDRDGAAALFTLAATNRLGEHALLSAEELARRALDVAVAGPLRADATDALARTLAAQGRWNDALALDESTGTEHGETPERRLRMASCAVEAGRPELAKVVIARAFEAGDESPHLHVIAGRVALADGDAQAALTAADSALAAATDLGERWPALELQGRALDFIGRRDEARRVWAQQAEEAAAAGLVEAHMRAVVQLSKLEVFEGAEPVRLYEAVELAAAAGALIEQAWAEENLGIALTIQGDPAAGRSVLEEALARCRALRLDQVPYLLTALGGARSFYDEASAVAAFAEAEALTPTIDLAIHTHGIRADMALRMGHYEEGVALAERGAELIRSLPGGMPADTIAWLPWGYAALGRRDEAVAMLDAARSLPGDISRWHGTRVVLSAAEALLAGDEAGIDAALASATGRMPFDIALMKVIAAEVLRGPSAARWLADALAVYEDIGAERAAARVRRLLRDAGGRVPRRRNTGAGVPDALARQGVTSREADVLRLLGQGLSNAVISERLFVSVRTVESHVSSLLAKLHVESRGQLTALSATIEYDDVVSSS